MPQSIAGTFNLHGQSPNRSITDFRNTNATRSNADRQYVN